MNLVGYITLISNTTYEVIKQNKYIYALLIFLFFFIISKLTLFVIEKIFLRIAKNTKTKLDDLIIARIKNPLSLILVLIGIRISLHALNIHQKILDVINEINTALIIVTITYAVTRVVYVLIEHWKDEWVHKTKSHLDDHLIGLLNSTAKYVIWVLGFLFILQGFGIKIGPLLASLGIVGIAVAFAMQTTLTNIFGGVSLVIDQTIKAGDLIKLDSGELGTVVDIGIRSTKILTPDDILLSIPNGKLADSRIQNFSKPNNIIRITLDVGVEYGSDTEKVKEIIIDEISKIKYIEKNKEILVYFTDMADFSLKFKIFVWTNITKRFELQDLALTRIYKALNRNKIGIPFPTRTLYMKK